MQFDAKLAGDAATLAREHGEVLQRLPATVHAFVLMELQKWPTLFSAERRYQRALLEHLSGLRRDTLLEVSAGIRRVEIQGGVDTISEREPARFQDQAQAALRKRSLTAAWRREVDRFFQQIDPELDSRLYPPDAPRRLVVQLYGTGIALRPTGLWSRFKGIGTRIPLKVAGATRSGDFLRTLFAPSAGGTDEVSLFTRARETAGLDPLDAWVVESHEGLHEIVHRPSTGGTEPALTALSYDRLRGYRDELTRALYSKIQSGVESPQAFAAYARSLRVVPGDGLFPHSADLLQAFVREVLLTGNGTLFVNNTFVEWAAVQALRRAQPRVLVARYGVRDRLKPFSSLLLFSQPRTSDQIPIVEDPVGSFVDVEQLAYYVWLNAEKSPAYRQNTLYLFLAEEADEMLAIRSGSAAAAGSPASPVDLADVSATMAHWLGIPMPGTTGRPIASLVS